MDLRTVSIRWAAALSAAAFLLFAEEARAAPRSSGESIADEPTGGVRGSGAWTTLEGVRFDEGQYADGDSFHVRHHGRSYVFRLYFVDAPELDNTFKTRTKAQARYFGITKAEARQIAREAAAFTAQQLARTFTVKTEWADARGAGHTPRFFAWIETDQGSLAELLVQRGYARCFGATAHIPDVARSEEILRRLKRAEALARHDKVGAWALSSPASKKGKRGHAR
jgi:endonuclease YncB( thermonuclease family)